MRIERLQVENFKSFDKLDLELGNFNTTHNLEFVKHAGLEHLFLVTRDDEGFSRITRPKDSREVQVFLENEMGLDELFAQDLLDVAAA